MAKPDIEKIISNVNATMDMEGMPLTEDDKKELRACLEGKKKWEQRFRDIDRKYMGAGTRP